MFDPFGLVMDILEAVLDGFLSIFELAGQESIRRAVDTVLTAASPNLSSDWFIATYFVLFGFGAVLAVTVSLFRALSATWNNDAYKFFTVWKHNLLHYALGYWLPASYLVLHILVVQASEAAAGAFGINNQTPENINFTTGSIANRLFAGLTNWVLGGFLEAQTWFIISFLPTIVLLFGVFLLGAADIGGKKGEKVWSGFLALILTSLLSILLYVLWFGIASKLNEGIQMAEEVSSAVVWGTTIMLALALFTPFLAWYIGYKGISNAVMSGSALLTGQLRGSQQIRAMGGSQNGRGGSSQSASARRNSTRVRRADSRATRAGNTLKTVDEVRKGAGGAERFAIRSSQASSAMAKRASRRAAAGKSAAAAGTATGVLAVASIAATRSARRKVARAKAENGGGS